MKKMLEKIKSTKGESIGEVLVALLISSLALVLLASMITSSSTLIKNSRAKMSRYYYQNDILTKQSGSASEGSITFKLSGSAVNYPLVNSSDTAISVRYYINSESTEVVSYGK